MPKPEFKEAAGQFLRTKDVKQGEFVKFTTSGELLEKDFKGEKKNVFEINVVHNSQDKVMTLNKTSYENLAPAYGENTDDWIGRQAMITIKDYSDKGFPPGMVLMPCIEAPKAESKEEVEWDA